MRRVRSILLLASTLVAAIPAAAQVTAHPRPEGVRTVASHGAGNSSTARRTAPRVMARTHGEPTRASRSLERSGCTVPGTYEWLVEQIKLGIPAHETWTGKPMPMRGWSNMPDHDVRAVAAYVWAITHPPRVLRAKPRPS